MKFPHSIIFTAAVALVALVGCDLAMSSRTSPSKRISDFANEYEKQFFPQIGKSRFFNTDDGDLWEINGSFKPIASNALTEADRLNGFNESFVFSYESDRGVDLAFRKYITEKRNWSQWISEGYAVSGTDPYISSMDSYILNTFSVNIPSYTLKRKGEAIEATNDGRYRVLTSQQVTQLSN